MKKAKENWIGEECSETEENLRKNNSKRVYQLVKDLTTVKQEKATTVQDAFIRKMPHRRTRHTEQMDRILHRAVQSQGQWSSISNGLSPDRHRGWPPHSSKRSGGCSAITEKGKSTGVDNVSTKLVQAGGEDVITALTTICNKIWQSGEWPTPWTQSLVITLPKIGNLHQCQNYRRISLISHPSKVMLKIILNILKPQTEKIIAEEQAAFSAVS